MALTLENLAGVYNEQGAYAKAEPLFARALEIREKALGPMHPQTAYSLNNLGFLYFRQAAYAKAEPLLVRAVEVRERALGPMHPTLANSLRDTPSAQLQASAQGAGSSARSPPVESNHGWRGSRHAGSPARASN